MEISQPKWNQHVFYPPVNIQKTMEKSTFFYGKTRGKPWENHGKMVIYMERSTISMGYSTISTEPFSMSLFVCLPGQVYTYGKSGPSWALGYQAVSAVSRQIAANLSKPISKAPPDIVSSVDSQLRFILDDVNKTTVILLKLCLSCLCWIIKSKWFKSMIYCDSWKKLMYDLLKSRLIDDHSIPGFTELCHSWTMMKA